MNNIWKNVKRCTIPVLMCKMFLLILNKIFYQSDYAQMKGVKNIEKPL